MSKVNFIYNNGRERMMHVRYAEPLAKLGKGEYMTRDMRARSPEPDDLEAKTIEELRAIAEAKGIAVHHRAGPEKIINAIREAG